MSFFIASPIEYFEERTPATACPGIDITSTNPRNVFLNPSPIVDNMPVVGCAISFAA